MTEKRPLITTVIPTFRRPKLLRRAICSALNQTFPDIQVCVFDNASGDETASVVSEIAARDHRLKYFCHSHNIGLLGNIDFCLRHVETPYFSLLCDDDLLLPEFYETAMGSFHLHSKAMMSSLMTAHVTPTGEILRIPLHDWGDQELYLPGEAIHNMFRYGHPECTSILFRSELLTRLDGFNIQLGNWCDVDFELRVATDWPVCVTKKVGGLFVIHDDQASEKENSYSIWWEVLAAYNNWLPKCSKLGAVANAALSARFRRPCLDEARTLLWEGDFARAAKLASLPVASLDSPLEAKRLKQLAGLLSCSPLFFRVMRRLRTSVHWRHVRSRTPSAKREDANTPGEVRPFNDLFMAND